MSAMHAAVWMACLALGAADADFNLDYRAGLFACSSRGAFSLLRTITNQPCCTFNAVGAADFGVDVICEEVAAADGNAGKQLESARALSTHTLVPGLIIGPITHACLGRRCH